EADGTFKLALEGVDNQSTLLNNALFIQTVAPLARQRCLEGKLDRAEYLLQLLIDSAARIKDQDPDGYHTISFSRALNTYAERAGAKKALPYAESWLANISVSQGKNSASTLCSFAELGNIYRLMGRYHDAEAIQNKVLLALKNLKINNRSQKK